MNNNPFNEDVTLNGGYLYSISARLSSQLANERLTQITINSLNLSSKDIIDVGCGDGVYTNEIFSKKKLRSMLGIDISYEAIKRAQNLYVHNEKLQFKHLDIYGLPNLHRNFDCAIFRGVLHHVSNPRLAIQTVSRLTSEFLILEPNGYNPFLKVIEKISPYHRQHFERSYFPFQLRNWLAENNFKIVKDEYVGLVPFFAPDSIAKALKVIEPLVERTRVLSKLACAVYVVHAKKN